MIHLQIIGLLLACIGGSALAGLLPDGGANGYRYNRPSGQDFGSAGLGGLDVGRRGYADRFGPGGSGIGPGGFRVPGSGFGSGPSTAYGPPGFGNVGTGGVAFGPGSPGFVNRPSGTYGAPGTFTGGLPGGYQQQPGAGGTFVGGIGGYRGNGVDGAYYPGSGGVAGGGYNGDNGRPQPYSFQYEVRDPPSGNDYAQQESSDGNVVRGEYRVLLPDSRTQIVKYTADDANGYNADVQYEGQAQFPRPGGYNQFGVGPGDAGYQPGFGPSNNYQGGRGGYNANGAGPAGLGVGGFGGGIFPSGGGPGVGVGVTGTEPGSTGGGGGSTSNRYLPPGTGGYGK